jgi:hypothetical protein
MKTIIITQQPFLSNDEYYALAHFSNDDEDINVIWESNNDLEIKNIKKPIGYEYNGKFVDIEFNDVEFIHNY